MTQEEFHSAKEYILFEDGENVSKIYIGPSEYENYDDKTRQFLYDFICKQAIFPVFLTFEPYTDVTEEIESTLKKGYIQYTLRFESKKRKSFPVFHVVINNPYSLKLVLEETFWIASSNQFYALSFPNKIRYKLAIRRGIFGGKKPYMVPCINMRENSTIINIWFDGQGFNIYTNDSRYSTIEMLTHHIPKGTIIDNNQ
ncbi:hypothetical protein WQ54_17365 [Bacillus sp. SA1-12]|nr:hypothetical protein WQ54_17365 [Bacillus sp. SA1-12]